MKSRKKEKMKKNISLVLMIIFSFILLILFIVWYLRNVDDLVKKYKENDDAVFVSKDNIELGNGFYQANIKENLDNFINDKDIDSITYRIENEDFYFTIDIIRDEDISYRLEKIVGEDYGVNARVGIKDIDSVEYKTGNPIESTVIKIVSSNSLYYEYFAMTDNTYYILGNDIEDISYKDDHFYYLSYNPKYKILEEQQSCSKNVKNMIEGFNKSNYYYKYGEINFLPNFYQKLASKTYTVEQKCAEFNS